MKRTPLFKAHQKLGGKLIEFGGWEMPVHYTSIMDEHLAVREAGGLFDISHMGEVLVSGKQAEEFLNRNLTNELRKLEPGQGQYTLMCNQQGGAIDDLYVYRLGPELYLLIVNASRIEEDVTWLKRQLAAAGHGIELMLENVSDKMGAVALQGPRVAGFIDICFPGAAEGGTPVDKVSELKKNQIAKLPFQGEDIWLSRTGYTGEDGFEAVAPADRIEPLWERILQLGRNHGIKPAGLGARDTLRTEVCYPLYGHELGEQITPIEAGLGFFVALDKGEFMGRAVLAEQKIKGVNKRLVAFKMTGKSAPPRPHYVIWTSGGDGAQIGEVTSGTQSPSLGIGIGMGYVSPPAAAANTPIEIEIRGKRSPAMVAPKPLYRRPA